MVLTQKPQHVAALKRQFVQTAKALCANASAVNTEKGGIWFGCTAEHWQGELELYNANNLEIQQKIFIMSGTDGPIESQWLHKKKKTTYNITN